MRVVEQFIESKTGDMANCEDGLFINEHFACVVDGATSKTLESVYGNRTSGQVARDLIIEVISRFDKDVTCAEAIQSISLAVAAFYESSGITDKVNDEPYNRAIAAVLIYSRHFHEVWMVGDCQFMIDGELVKNEKEIDSIIANTRSLYLETELQLGKTVDDLLKKDTGREYIFPLLQRQQLFQNPKNPSPFGYGVIDGFLVQPSHILCKKLDQSVKQLILASDGYPILCNTLQESEELLSELLLKDPLCFRENKSTKGLNNKNVSFDDRAYLSIGF